MSVFRTRARKMGRMGAWMDMITGWDGWWSFMKAWEWMDGQKQRVTKHQSHEIRYMGRNESNEWKEMKLWLHTTRDFVPLPRFNAVTA
jgi:hypothetical protein